MHVSDSLYIPWQMFTTDLKTPVVVAHERHITAKQTKETSANTTQSKTKTSQPSSINSTQFNKQQYYWLFMFVVLLLIVRLAGRRL